MLRTKQIQRPELVLVVDDHEINRDALGVILESDYEVIFAKNGEEALELMRKHQKELSIVLLDLMMPVMNGYEVLTAVKNDPELKDLPIIVLTADKDAELQALEMGAADFITKPFDLPGIILARVGRIIELSEGRQLISAAENDPLTMLYSKNFFYEYANRLFLYHRDMHLDAIVLNIDKFHSVNALHGRDFGDHVLRALGDEINLFLRETQGIASRFEADRFGIYCLHREDYPQLLSRFQERLNALSSDVNLHIRMGVNVWQEEVTPVLMFDRAQAACNMIRGDFQNSLKIYNDEMLNKELLNQRLLNDLRAAVEEGQFVVYYQPKYNIQNDVPTLSSAEALVRWKHPELGMISPGDFVPLFESNGLISVVDNYVWNETARQIVRWRDKYGFTLPVSVNLSRSDVFDPSLIDRLVSIVEDNKLEYRQLKLEVTESSYTDNALQVLDVIRRLREKGFEIEMDDFGSGYSSLNMLSDMPIDVLKMDMKFIRNLENNDTDRRLVSLILDIAKYLNVAVVAEGVETRSQLNILRFGGCDLVQGYYFSRPLPPEEFEKLLVLELQKRSKGREE